MKLFGFEFRRTSDTGNRVVPTSLDWGQWLSFAGLGVMQPTDFHALVKAYKSWVYTCASKNSTSVAQAALRLFVAKPSKKMKLIVPTKAVEKDTLDYLLSDPAISSLGQVKKAVEIEEVIEHPFLDLMANVNSFMNRFDLWESTELFQELTGNAYWWVRDNGLKIPSEIWVLPSDRVRAVPGTKDEKFVKGYIYTVGTMMIPFDESEVIHFKFASPTSMLYGMSPLAGIADTYNINQKMDNYEAAVFKNMGVPAGFLETEQKVTDDEFKAWKKRWDETYGGANKQGKMGFLDRGLKFTKAQMTPKEMAYVIGRKLTKEQIMNAFGQSLGMFDANATRANSEMASYTYMRDAIRPRLVRLEQKMNEKLIPRYDKRLFVAFDNPVPEDKDRILKAREVHLKTGTTVVNEERAVLGMPPVDWGDVPFAMPRSEQGFGKEVG